MARRRTKSESESGTNVTISISISQCDANLSNHDRLLYKLMSSFSYFTIHSTVNIFLLARPLVETALLKDFDGLVGSSQALESLKKKKKLGAAVLRLDLEFSFFFFFFGGDLRFFLPFAFSTSENTRIIYLSFFFPYATQRLKKKSQSILCIEKIQL